MQNHYHNDPEEFDPEEPTSSHAHSQDRKHLQPYEKKNVLSANNFPYLGERPLVNTIPVYQPSSTSRRGKSSVSSDSQSGSSSVSEITLSPPISSEELAQFWSFMGDTTMPLFESLPIVSEGSALALQDLGQGPLGIFGQSRFYEAPSSSSEASSIPSYNNHSVSENPRSILIGNPPAPHILEAGVHTVMLQPSKNEEPSISTELLRIPLHQDQSNVSSLAGVEGVSTSNTVTLKRSRLSSEDPGVTNENVPDFIAENKPTPARVTVTETPDDKIVYRCDQCNYKTGRLDNFERHLKTHESKTDLEAKGDLHKCPNIGCSRGKAGNGFRLKQYLKAHLTRCKFARPMASSSSHDTAS